MSMSAPKQPTYRKHRASGQAIVTLTDGLGGRKDVLLGKYGTVASKREYDRVIQEWLANGRTFRKARTLADMTVNELIERWDTHAEQYYGTGTTELAERRYSLRPLRYLYGESPAAQFGPLALKAVRNIMVQGYDHPKYGKQSQLCRILINKRIGRIKRMFA